MKHLDLLNEFRELIAHLRYQVEAASAMDSYDTHKVAENVMCGLMRELCGWSQLRNLNTEQVHFPGIDLADDSARIAVQVTATADLAKIKHSIETFVGRDLNQQYSRLIVYVLTNKQGSYSQTSIDASTNGKLRFSAGNDVWDFQDLCSKASAARPQKLQAAINHLKAYLRGIPIGLADEDFDPPASPPESLLSNLVELYFPKSLYVASLNSELVALHGKKTARTDAQDNSRIQPNVEEVRAIRLCRSWRNVDFVCGSYAFHLAVSSPNRAWYRGRA